MKSEPNFCSYDLTVDGYLTLDLLALGLQIFDGGLTLGVQKIVCAGKSSFRYRNVGRDYGAPIVANRHNPKNLKYLKTLKPKIGRDMIGYCI